MDARIIDPRTQRVLSLRSDELARMHGAARLHVTRGLLWLTLDRERDDHLLQPGEGFTLERRGRALLQGMAPDTRVVVAATEPAPSLLQRAVRALHAAMQHVAGAAT